MASKRIKGITIEIDGNATKLQKSLAGLDKTIGTTQTKLRDISKLLKIDPKNTELLTQKQKALKSEVDALSTRLKELQSISKESVSPEDWDTLQREIIDTEQKLNSLKKEYESFGSVGSQKIAAVGTELKKVGSDLVGMGENITKKVTLPIVAGAGASVAKFAEVDKTMQLTNSTMKNTEAEAQALNRAMEDAARNSVYGMSDAAGATLNFARAGLDAEQAAAALAPAMNLAAGEGGNLDTVSGGLVATINGFGDSFNNASYYADIFAAACNNSELDVDSLSGAMAVAAPIFKASGKSVEDAALYMGVMANNGIDASTAANSLKTGFARLASPTDEAKKQMEAIGIEIFNADGSMKDSVQIQKELHDSFAGLSEQEQLAAAAAIFGKNQMAPWLALISSAPESVGALSESLSTSTGTANQMAEAMLGGFGGALETLMSSIDVLMYQLGSLVAVYLQPVIDKITEIITWFSSLDAGTQQIIVTIALVVAAIGPLLMGIGKIVVLVGQVMTFAPAIVAALGPVGIAIAAVTAAVVAIGIAVITHWDEIKAKTLELVTNVKNKFEEFKLKMAELAENIRGKVEEVKQKFEDLKANIKAKIDAIKQKFEDFRIAAAAKFDAVKQKFDQLKTSFGQKVDQIKGFFRELKENTIGMITEMYLGVKQKFDDIKTAITKPINDAKQTVSDAISRIKEIFAGAHFEFPHIKTPHFSWYWRSIGGLVSIPQISIDWYKKAYDTPYLFTSPTVMQTGAGLKGFGDGNGGEIVYSHDRLMKDISQASGGAKTYTVNIYAPEGMDINALAQKVQDKFVQWDKQRGAAYA